MLRLSGRDSPGGRSRHPCAVAPAAPWGQTPQWGWLYAALLVIAVIGLTAEGMAPSLGWRRLVEVLTGVAAVGAIALWLRLNRLRLAYQESGLRRPGWPVVTSSSRPEAAGRQLTAARRSSRG